MSQVKQDLHVSSETIELYCMGRMQGPSLDEFEEHLLACEQCQDDVARTDSYILAMRNAAKSVAVESPGVLSAFGNCFRFTPRLAMAGALAAAVAVTVTVPLVRPQKQTVELAAMRGNGASGPKIKSGRPVDIQLDATDLPPSASYTTELVDSTGKAVAQGSAEAREGRITISVANSLAPGRYWARVYSNSLKTDLLREFGLTVE